MTITTNTTSTVKELLGDLIIAERLPSEKVSAGGIYLLETSGVNTQKTGIQVCVMMVGSQFIHKEAVKKGDIVLVSKYVGTIIDKTKEDIRIYDGEDVLAIVDNNE